MGATSATLPQTTQWPAAVEVVNEHGRSSITLICEHASNYIPPEYHNLGLPPEHVQRHIAWDIGAANVTRTLSSLLDAPAFLGTYSRLLIDLNRPLGALAAIPVRSEGTDIPGNHLLSPAERERRVQTVFAPFHARLAAHIHARERAGQRNVLVSIHSFTPVFLSEERPWHAGILFGKATQFGQEAIEHLSRDPALNVGANVPYGVSREEDYALIVHGDDRRNPAILIEIRHDQIAAREGADEWARRLAATLSATAPCDLPF